MIPERTNIENRQARMASRNWVTGSIIAQPSVLDEPHGCGNRKPPPEREVDDRRFCSRRD